MAIDILFIIMAAFGFYFGYTFGLMKVALMVVSLGFATFSAMAFTPMTTELIIETFHINSVFLPFVAFLITLLVVLMLARIVTKLIEETVDGKQFDIISQVVGGLVMAFIFTLLYSVLVTFFGKAHVIDLVFNQETIVTSVDKNIKLAVPAKVFGEPDTIELRVKDNRYKFAGTKSPEGVSAVNLPVDFDLFSDGSYLAYVKGKRTEDRVDLLPNDTVYFKASGRLELSVQHRKKKTGTLVGTNPNELICFCDSTFLVTAQNDTLLFHCMDKYLSAQNTTSIFYKYIEVIPKRGYQILEGLAPFVESFFKYMSVALERLDAGELHGKKPINSYSPDENKTPAVPSDDGSVFEENDTLNTNVFEDSLPAYPDSVETPLPDSSTIPEEPEEENEDEPVEYEG